MAPVDVPTPFRQALSLGQQILNHTIRLREGRPLLQHDLSAVNVRFSASASGNGTATTADHQPSALDRGQPQFAVIDFGQPRESAGNYAVETSNPITGAAATSTSEKDSVEDERPSNRSSGIVNRLSYIAKSVARPHSHRPSIGNIGQSARQSFSSIPEDQTPKLDPGGLPSRVARRLSYVAQGIGSYRASVINNTRSFRRSIFRLSQESYDIESYHEPKRSSKRNSKAIPKSWRFLGIDEHIVGHAVHGVKSNVREMYDKAKVKQQQIKRSKTAELIFRYAFYIVLISMVYLVFVGLPLWRGLVWYMYILFQKHLVLKAGLAITFGISFLQVSRAPNPKLTGAETPHRYAFAPLLINFEPTAPLPEADESGRTEPSACDTALIIPCYKSEKLIGSTLQAALKIFPKESIFVIANGNSPEPLDNTAEVCAEFGVSHTWSPMGSKIIAQFVGCYVARKFVNILLIDDDCLLPPNLPIVSDRMRGNIKCIGYIMKATGPDGSLGTLCQQSQDLEYKLSSLAKAFAGKVGSVTFPHGCIVLWNRELLIETFQRHPGFSVSEDWFFGHAARQLGSRITMCTSAFMETEVPRMYYDMYYILCEWKLGWWEIGAKIFVFQEVYETLLYLLAPFVIPISFATRPTFSSYLYAATIAMYAVNALSFNCFHLRSRNQSVSFKAFIYYNAFKWILGFVNIASCYYAIWTYATYFAKRHPKIVEDDRAVEIVLNLEQKDVWEKGKGEIEDLNELMGRIARPVGGGSVGKRRSVIQIWG
ncbi:MAG: hypothetical protein Q9176_006845 [Flavoplaca citrina]